MEALPVQSRDDEKRAISRALRLSLIAALVIAVVLLALLISASGNTRLFEDSYPMLLGLATLVSVMLTALVLELLRRLLARYRRGLFGTRLIARMAGSFALMTVLPVALVFFVAVQFVGRSIESWFDFPVERALDSGLSLARTSPRHPRRSGLPPWVGCASRPAPRRRWCSPAAVASSPPAAGSSRVWCPTCPRPMPCARYGSRGSSHGWSPPTPTVPDAV
jgi:hypothetical protein